MSYNNFRSGRRKGVNFIVCKIVANVLYAVLLSYYWVILSSLDDTFQETNVFGIDLAQFTAENQTLTTQPSFNICKNNETQDVRQEANFLSREITTYILLPIISVLWVISSIEILVFLFCHKSWANLLYGVSEPNQEDRITLKVIKVPKRLPKILKQKRPNTENQDDDAVKSTAKEEETNQAKTEDPKNTDDDTGKDASNTVDKDAKEELTNSRDPTDTKSINAEDSGAITTTKKVKNETAAGDDDEETEAVEEDLGNTSNELSPIFNDHPQKILKREEDLLTSSIENV
eukprot:GFUD01020646.1.p1 GENE.GFUD01020646.1~~GFUD01020646.1.p1  ORF type:complete len:289 (+),score=78.04 GFUD01020646.1:818-1684(+)